MVSCSGMPSAGKQEEHHHSRQTQPKAAKPLAQSGTAKLTAIAVGKCKYLKPHGIPAQQPTYLGLASVYSIPALYMRTKHGWQTTEMQQAQALGALKQTKIWEPQMSLRQGGVQVTNAPFS